MQGVRAVLESELAAPREERHRVPTARGVSADTVRRLQATAGNRAVRRLLSRVPYDAKLAQSDSVVQPPVSWVKYPPNPMQMTRVELFDALHLLDDWLSASHKQYVDELKALRERLKAYAKAVTTQAEYSTFRRYVKFAPDRLGEGYERVMQYIVADRRELDVISLDALDEVVQDRFPGAKWPAAARKWIEAQVREQDRRAARFDKLLWYQKGSFEKYEKNISKLADPAHDIWRELAWMWIDMRDAGQSREAIEKRVLGELEGMYESVLREMDKAIQADCKARAPRTWDEKIRNNIAKAWGDPCKPWFSDGGKGWDELAHFGRVLRIKRDDDPFASLFYWVEHYSNAVLLLTDPKAQLAEMQKQAMSSLFVHWATLVGMSPALAGTARGLIRVALRRGATFLRNTMIGFQLAAGDAGSIAAEAGAAKRPTIAAIGRLDPVVGRPAPTAAKPGPTTPDLPTRPSTPAKPPATPTAKPPATPTAKPPPTPVPATPKTPAPAPAKTLPPPPPPAFVKARSLTHLPDPTKDSNAVEKVKAMVIRALTKHKWGTDEADLPLGWKSIYDALRQDASDAAKTISKHLHVVWGALRDPELYADVLSEAWKRAWLEDSSVESVLIAMAQETSGNKPVWIPRSQADYLLKNPGKFFDLYGSREASFVDLPLLGDPHKAVGHLLQDLVVDRAFKELKIDMTSGKFRALLGKTTGRFVPPEKDHAPVIAGVGTRGIRTGDYVWQMTYDLFLRSRDHLPQPEVMGRDFSEIFWMK
jgi:hypothetical protein